MEIVAGTPADSAATNVVRRVANALDGGVSPKLVDDGLGGTYFIRDEDGSELAVFKPRDEEPNAINNPKSEGHACLGEQGIKGGILIGDAALHEVAAYVLDARASHFSRVPPTAIARSEHTAFFDSASGEGSSYDEAVHCPFRSRKTKVGSVQRFVPHDGSADDFSPSLFSVLEVQRVACLDIRLFNTDRHGANLLVQRVPPPVSPEPSHPASPLERSPTVRPTSPQALADGTRWPVSGRRPTSTSPTGLRGGSPFLVQSSPLDGTPDGTPHGSPDSSPHGSPDGSPPSDAGLTLAFLPHDSPGALRASTTPASPHSAVAPRAMRSLTASLTPVGQIDEAPIDEGPGLSHGATAGAPSSPPSPTGAERPPRLMVGATSWLPCALATHASGPEDDAAGEWPRLVPIDHGFCLPAAITVPSFEWQYWPQARAPLHPCVLEHVRSLDVDADAALLSRLLGVSSDGLEVGLHAHSITTFRVSTLVLRSAAEHGRTLLEIAELMCEPDELSAPLGAAPLGAAPPAPPRTAHAAGLPVSEGSQSRQSSSTSAASDELPSAPSPPKVHAQRSPVSILDVPTWPAGVAELGSLDAPTRLQRMCDAARLEAVHLLGKSADGLGAAERHKLEETAFLDALAARLASYFGRGAH